MKYSYLGLSALVLFGLSACGGGGSDSTPAPTYTIQVGSFTGGSISPTSVSVSQGQTAAFSVTADTGFELVSVTGCAGTLTGTTYRTGPITAACSITATFTKKNYAVSATAGNGGAIAPNAVSVPHGDTTAFDITANTGFAIAGVTGCGGSLAGSRYTTAAITAACEVVASFSVLQFAVTATSQGNGAISPAQQVANYNDSLTFTLAPAAGYSVATVTGCGGTLQGLSYVTAPVTAACAITASFTPTEYTLSAVATGGGSITPGSIKIPAGGRAEFVVTANNGFRFKQLDGCDGRFADNKFIVENVTASCAIVAQFNPVDVVEFADAQLARAVKTELGITLTEPVSAARLAQLTHLSASGLSISRLDGLQYAVSLQYLDVSNNTIDNFSILNFLAAEQQPAKLTALYLSNNPVTSLPGFSRLTALRDLSLQGIGLDSLPALGSLSELRYLNLAYNQLTDLTALTGVRLSTLYLNGNPLPDNAFAVLSGMPLTTLHVDNTNFTSAERINMLDNLRDFSANYTQLSNLNPLMGLRFLTRLSLYGSQVVDLRPLLNMFPENNAVIYAGGCFKTTGFARAPTVIEELNRRGNYVQLYTWATPYDAGCNAGNDLIKDLAITASMDNRGLQLDWSLTSNDTGPWRCELHLNLGEQQARAPVKVLEDCHLTRSWLVPEFNQDVTEPHLVIDNGLVKTTTKINAGRVVHAAGLNDPYVEATDWLQVVAKNNPYLVPYRAAKLRLHLVSATNKAPPVLDAWLQDGATRTPLTVTAPTQLPAQIQQGSLSESYLVSLPASSAKPGVSIVVNIAGHGERTFTPQFAAVNSLDLTIVPFKLGEMLAPVPENSLIENSILSVWPFASVNITKRQPYTLSAAANLNNNFSMLSELYDLQVAEGETSFYYGYYTREMNNDGWGGMAWRPGMTGVGLVPFGELDYTLSHELGHNLSIQHAPCGNPAGVDANYPYDGASIGTYGVPLSFNTLLSPSVYKDLMGYCGTQHVSDYNLELVQDYITEQQSNPGLHLRTPSAGPTDALSASAMAAKAVPQAAMFYRFDLSEAAAPAVLQAMQVARLPLLKANSRFTVLAEFSQGAPLPVPVQKLVFGHGDGAEQISFAVPLTNQGASLVAWSLFDGQRILKTQQVAQTAQLAGNIQAAPAVRIEEQAGEICVFVAGRVDGVNLTLVQQDKTTVVALNERSAQFCRVLDGMAAGGNWQVQTRQGLSVQLFEYVR